MRDLGFSYWTDYWTCPRCDTTICEQNVSLLYNSDFCPHCGFSSNLVPGEGVELQEPIQVPPGIQVTQGSANDWKIAASTRGPARNALTGIAFFIAIAVFSSIRSPAGAFFVWIVVLCLLWRLLPFAAMQLAGQISVKVHNGRGMVFTGIPYVGSRDFFDLSELKAIRIKTRVRENFRRESIVLQTSDRFVEFGALLRPDQRHFMADFLRRRACECKPC